MDDDIELLAKNKPGKWLCKLISLEKKELMLLSFNSIINIITTILIAFLAKKIVDSAFNYNSHELIRILSVFLAVIIIRTIFIYTKRYCSGKISGNLMVKLRKYIFSYIQSIQVSYLENNHLGAIISIFTSDVLKVEGFLEKNLYLIVFTPISILIISVCMFYIKWNLFITTIAIIPVVMLVSYLILRSITQLSTRLQKDTSKSNMLTMDAISGVSVIKAYNLEAMFTEKFSKVANSILKNGLAIVLKISSLTPLLYVFRGIPQVACTIYGGYLICKGEMTPGDLVAFMFLLNMMISNFYSIPNIMSDYNTVKGVIVHLMSIYDMPVENKEQCLTDNVQYDKAIEFKKVYFNYDGRREILNDLTFSVSKGRITSIVGESGAGKSTILKILLGYYLPSKGSVFIEGIEINERTLKQCRDKISFVSQDTYLMPNTIYKNISCACENVNEEDVYKAAEAANIHEYILGLKDGYNTIIGESGINLSGGQKQRIAIARALLKNTPIILLDEPTSALDSESESIIIETLNKLKKEKTVVIISHRISTINIADEIIVIKDGAIIEQGTHKKLYNEDSYYRELYSGEIVLQV